MPTRPSVIAALRERRPALPILMLTANGSVAQAVAAMRAGATDFLVKPLAPERLLAALEAAVALTSEFSIIKLHSISG